MPAKRKKNSIRRHPPRRGPSLLEVTQAIVQTPTARCFSVLPKDIVLLIGSFCENSVYIELSHCTRALRQLFLFDVNHWEKLSRHLLDRLMPRRHPSHAEILAVTAPLREELKRPWDRYVILRLCDPPFMEPPIPQSVLDSVLKLVCSAPDEPGIVKGAIFLFRVLTAKEEQSPFPPSSDCWVPSVLQFFPNMMRNLAIYAREDIPEHTSRFLRVTHPAQSALRVLLYTLCRLGRKPLFEILPELITMLLDNLDLLLSSFSDDRELLQTISLFSHMMLLACIVKDPADRFFQRPEQKLRQFRSMYQSFQQIDANDLLPWNEHQVNGLCLCGSSSCDMNKLPRQMPSYVDWSLTAEIFCDKRHSSRLKQTLSSDLISEFQPVETFARLNQWDCLESLALQHPKVFLSAGMAYVCSKLTNRARNDTKSSYRLQFLCQALMVVRQHRHLVGSSFMQNWNENCARPYALWLMQQQPTTVASLDCPLSVLISLRQLLALSPGEFLEALADADPLTRHFVDLTALFAQGLELWKHQHLLFQEITDAIRLRFVEPESRTEDNNRNLQAPLLKVLCKLIDVFLGGKNRARAPMHSEEACNALSVFWKGSLEEEETSRIYGDSYRAVLKLKVLLHEGEGIIFGHSESKPLDASGGSYLRCSICDVLSPASPNVVETAQSVLSPSELELLCHDMCKDCALKTNERSQESKPSVRSSNRSRHSSSPQSESIDEQDQQDTLHGAYNLSSLPETVLTLIGRYLSPYYYLEDSSVERITDSLEENGYLQLSMCSKALRVCFQNDQYYWDTRLKHFQGTHAYEQRIRYFDRHHSDVGQLKDTIRSLSALFHRPSDLFALDPMLVIVRLSAHYFSDYDDEGQAEPQLPFPSRILMDLVSMDLSDVDVLHLVTLFTYMSWSRYLIKEEARVIIRALVPLSRKVAAMCTGQRRVLHVPCFCEQQRIIHHADPVVAILQTVQWLVERKSNSFPVEMVSIFSEFTSPPVLNSLPLCWLLRCAAFIESMFSYLIPSEEGERIDTFDVARVTNRMHSAIETTSACSRVRWSSRQRTTSCSCMIEPCMIDRKLDLGPKPYLLTTWNTFACDIAAEAMASTTFTSYPTDAQIQECCLFETLLPEKDTYCRTSALKAVVVSQPHTVSDEIIFQIIQKLIRYLSSEDRILVSESSPELLSPVLQLTYIRSRDDPTILKRWKKEGLTRSIMQTALITAREATEGKEGKVNSVRFAAHVITSLRFLLKLSPVEFMPGLHEIVCPPRSPSPLSRLTFPPFFCMEEPSARRHLLLLFQDILDAVEAGMASRRSDDRRQACQAFERCLVDMLVVPLRSAGPPEWEIPFWKGSLEEEKTSRIYGDSYRAVLKLKVLLHDKGLVTHCNCESKPLDASGGSYLRCSICDVLSPASPNVVETAQSVLSPSELELLCHDMCKDCALKTNERGQESKPSVRSSKRRR